MPNEAILYADTPAPRHAGTMRCLGRDAPNILNPDLPTLLDPEALMLLDPDSPAVLDPETPENRYGDMRATHRES